MKRFVVRAFAILALAASAACGGRTALPPSDATAFVLRAALQAQGFTRACATRLPGHRACEALLRAAATPVRALPSGACRGAAPYCPADLQAAYGLLEVSRTLGSGVTLAIVDAYGYPSARADLARYRAAMGLPRCDAGCLRIVNQLGDASPLPPFERTDDWRFEQALDLDMASAICPHCRLLLVQARSDRNDDVDRAVDAAVALGAAVVSNSYTGPETGAYDAAYDHPGRAIVASAGDGGAEPLQPCMYASVVCVGGTSLQRDASTARGWRETAWGGSGSGCSAFVPKPAWQTDAGCARRSGADLSAQADPVTGVWVSLRGAWVPMGGTSASAPIVAGAFALARSAAAGAFASNAAQTIWSNGAGGAFNDVVWGSNPGRFACDPGDAYLCRAGPGYDGPTGWGTLDGLRGLQSLERDR